MPQGTLSFVHAVPRAVDRDDDKATNEVDDVVIDDVDDIIPTMWMLIRLPRGSLSTPSTSFFYYSIKTFREHNFFIRTLFYKPKTILDSV